MLIINLKFALQALKKNVLRGILTVFQITLGLALLVATINLNMQAQITVNEKYKNQGSLNRIDGLRSGNTIYGLELEKEEYEEAKNSQDSFPWAIEEGYYFLNTYAQGKKFALYSLFGVDADYPSVCDLEIVAGDFFSENDIENPSNIILLDEYVANVLFASPEEALNQKLTVGVRISTGNGYLEEQVEFVVSGVFRNSENMLSTSNALIPWTLKNGPFGRECVNKFVYKEPIELSQRETEMMIANGLEVGVDDLAISGKRWAKDIHLNFVTGSIKKLRIFAGLSLMVAAISIMSVNMVNTLERSREIGLKRALGVSKGNIVGQFLIEFSIYSVLGSLGGLLAGYFLQFIFRQGTNTPYSLNYYTDPKLLPSTVILTVLIALFVGTLFSLFPAWQATNIPPTEVLKEE